MQLYVIIRARWRKRRRIKQRCQGQKCRSLTGKYQRHGGLPGASKWVKCDKFNEKSKSVISA